MDQSIAFQSSPHISAILSVVRPLLVEIYSKYVFAFIMLHSCIQEFVWYLTLVIATQGQSVAVSAHHQLLLPQTRRAEVVLLPGVPLFSTQPSHFILSNLFSYIQIPLISGRINTNKKTVALVSKGSFLKWSMHDCSYTEKEPGIEDQSLKHSAINLLFISELCSHAAYLFLMNVCLLHLFLGSHNSSKIKKK